MFEELLGSVREAGAILRGQKKPSLRVVIGPSNVRRIRERTGLSQSEFAHLIGVSAKTLQNWEQDRRRPTGPAAALLKIIAHEPQLAMKAMVQAHSSPTERIQHRQAGQILSQFLTRAYRLTCSQAQIARHRP